MDVSWSTSTKNQKITTTLQLFCFYFLFKYKYHYNINVDIRHYNFILFYRENISDKTNIFTINYNVFLP